ncbi:hypothetical protein P5F75_11020 [Caldifermentibacillus hisashii]|uniref:hypothetical protein n=1 Tax=Caldifermentibacillus hisashii TaxID=996558 RepID=UPI002E1FE384|nr:hypothetical protein [Caldifermentibacillus hisashii]
MTTRANLVTILRWKSLIFDDEPRSRHHFSVRNALFWRRALFSLPFFGEKRSFLTTRLILVTVFW